MENIIENLKSNFLFQASLGSKELFHSNLIAWILEQENENGEYEALIIFLKTINIKVSLNSLKKENEVKISREENNIDLIIKWKENEKLNYVFIENKMKSIPTSNQLEEYNEKVKKYTNQEINNKILLTPFSTILKKDKHTENWINITYKKEIISFLKNIQYIVFKNPDINLIVSKYISFIEDIINLFDLYLGKDENEFERKKYNYYTSELEHLRSIRMHDMLLKIMHDKLGDLIMKKIKNSNLEIKTNFTRSTGINDIFYKLHGTNYTIGLQIQSNTLKYCFMCEPNLYKNNIAISKKLIDSKLWFYDFSSNPPILLNGKGRDKNKNGLKIDDTRTFCEYDNAHFLYLTKSLKEFEDKPIIDLVNFIAEEFKQLINNKDKIIKIVNEF
jgi:hypothetical protein